MESSAYENQIQWYNDRQNEARIDVSDMGLGTLTELIHAGFIDLDPDYQRRERWDIKTQSELIDSFMRNIPVPPAYLAEDQAKRGTYAVIDGKQRLTAISDFILNQFKLSEDLQSPFAGNYFTDLPAQVQVSLKLKTLRTTTILHGSDLKIVHEVFIRLNTGGEPLSRQEVRNVAYYGKLNETLITLSQNEYFRTKFGYTKDSESYKKMADIEMILRFFTLHHLYLETKANEDNPAIKLPNGLAGAMDDYMNTFRNPSADELIELKNLFTNTLEAVDEIWGTQAFRTEDRDQSRSPLYDAEMIAVASILKENEDAINLLKQNQEEIINATNETLRTDSRFLDSITKGTNTPSKIIYRIETISDILRTFL